jgi:GNAT superfamily N-acetyltransferase
MIIRRAKNTDLDKVLLLYGYLHDNDATTSKDTLESIWQKIIGSDIFIYFVIELDNIIVCSCNLTIIPNLTRGGRSIGLVENVVTHLNYRNSGLGKAIMNTAIDFAKDKNCYKVMLLSNSKREEAHRFYESLGFNSDSKIAYIKKIP